MAYVLAWCVSFTVYNSSFRSWIDRCSRFISPSFWGMVAYIWLKVSSWASSPIECREGTVSRLLSFRSRYKDSLAIWVSRCACWRCSSNLSVSLRRRMDCSLDLRRVFWSCKNSVYWVYFWCFSCLICYLSISSSYLLFLSRAASWL